jgi:hypothetical protein
MHFGTQKKQQIHTGDGSFDLGGVMFESQWLGSLPEKKLIHPQVSDLRIANDIPSGKPTKNYGKSLCY